MLTVVIPNPRGGRNSTPHRFPDDLCVCPYVCAFMHLVAGCANKNLLVWYRDRIYITEHVGTHTPTVCFCRLYQDAGMGSRVQSVRGRVSNEIRTLDLNISNYLF